MNYTQLTREQRYQISALLKMGHNRAARAHRVTWIIENRLKTITPSGGGKVTGLLVYFG